LNFTKNTVIPGCDQGLSKLKAFFETGSHCVIQAGLKLLILCLPSAGITDVITMPGFQVKICVQNISGNRVE
jgi:hypothetical protein